VHLYIYDNNILAHYGLYLSIHIYIKKFKVANYEHNIWNSNKCNSFKNINLKPCFISCMINEYNNTGWCLCTGWCFLRGEFCPCDLCPKSFIQQLFFSFLEGIVTMQSSTIYWYGRSFQLGARSLRVLAVACWTTNHYHPCSNLGVGISEGCFVFHFVSLPLEVTRPI